VIKESYHPNAYLQAIRNVASGLAARTQILVVLDQQASSARSIAEVTSKSYNVVFHHLQLLEKDGTVRRIGKKPYSWILTGLGQKRLVG
jgi:predicted transcriptional regulator